MNADKLVAEAKNLCKGPSVFMSLGRIVAAVLTSYVVVALVIGDWDIRVWSDVWRACMTVLWMVILAWWGILWRVQKIWEIVVLHWLWQEQK